MSGLGPDAVGLEVLVEALADHDRGLVTDHPTIGACWDADRLALWRVGITPDPARLCTAHARDAEIIHWSTHAERALPTWHDLAQACAAAITA